MKRIAFALTALAALAAGRAAVAQVAPARPVPPAAPVAPKPVPAPAPMVAPLPPLAPDWPLDAFDIDDIKRAARNAIDAQRPMIAEQARLAAEQARMQADMARDLARVDADRIRDDVKRAVMFDLPINYDFKYDLQYNVNVDAKTGDRLGRSEPPQAWLQGDPADSLYRAARDVLNHGDWGRAARMFADIQKNYPNSGYVAEAQYWEAWSRYKIGTTDELHAAVKILEPLATGATGTAVVTQAGNQSTGKRGQMTYTASRRTSNDDILALYARINGALAQRGDADAAAKVAKVAATQGAACDQDDITVRTEALNALSQMDPDQALPLLRRVLDRKDDCSSSLRRNAVFMLGRRSDADGVAILTSVAKSDPDANVRMEAINALGRTGSDASVATLEDILKSDQDERIQRTAVRALMSSDNARGRSAMRALIDRKDARVALRTEAINSFSSDRATADDAAYLRGLFNKDDDMQIKMAVLNAVSRIGGPENDQWVMNVARNTGEATSVRSAALSRLSRSPTVTTADLSKLYDASAESYDMRNRIINLLGSRKDQDATDKLIEIVRTSTVVQNRTQAIVALRDKKDPKATQALMDLLDGKRP